MPDSGVQENLYDEEGLRAGLRECGKLSTFLYYNGEILAECNGESMPIRRHLSGLGTSGLQILEDSQYYACHQDEQGSTIYITGRDGAVENCYAYDAFGNTLEKKEGIQNHIQYTGQQYDQETGQYYLRARYYNPAIGRFTQEDTYRGDGLNLYAYCKNNPVVYYDPSGHNQTVNPANGPETTNTAGVENDFLRNESITESLPDGNCENGNNINWEAHNVVNYAKLKEQYKVTELANDVVDSIKQTGTLPSDYITKSQAEAMGWSSGKALNNYAPGMALGGDIFENSNGVLPNADGRIWYEADVGIDYTMSRSNPKNPAYRILYSSDGLIYGTFDHYDTVFQIIP